MQSSPSRKAVKAIKIHNEEIRSIGSKVCFFRIFFVVPYGAAAGVSFRYNLIAQEIVLRGLQCNAYTRLKTFLGLSELPEAYILPKLRCRSAPSSYLVSSYVDSFFLSSEEFLIVSFVLYNFLIAGACLQWTFQG